MRAVSPYLLSTLTLAPSFKHNLTAPSPLLSVERVIPAKVVTGGQIIGEPQVQDRGPHQVHGLLGGVVVFCFLGPTHDEFRGRRVPDGRVPAGFSIPRRILLLHKPAWLVLEPVKR